MKKKYINGIVLLEICVTEKYKAKKYINIIMLLEICTMENIKQIKVDKCYNAFRNMCNGKI